MSVQIIDSNIIKKTQDSLGKIIKKPPMTEKLLSKPPFLFLHDIMTSVIKTTGFMNGLFSETEMNKDNIKDKETKISFLQKVIDMISLVLGKTLSARPSKIISGNEPEKTNEMLQMLAEAINKKIDNDEYVQRVLRSDDDGIKKKKESSRHKKEKQDVNEMDDNKINAFPEKRSRNEVRHRDDEKHKIRDKDKHEDDGAKKEDNRERRRHDKRGEETKERSKERRDDRNGKSERHRSRKRDEDEDDNGRHEMKRQSKRTTEGDKMNKTVERTHEQSGVKDAPTDISNQEVAKSPVGVNRISKPERPSSARPAPPKPRKNEETQDEIRLNQNVIIDKPHGSDDEDDFITKEIVDNQRGRDDNDVKRDHGILVKKILDTKKDLETHANYTKKTEIGHSEELVDASRTKDKQQMSKEIEKIRSMIQETTRNINPLGKTLDFLQESMDSMMKEINMWDEEAKHNKKLISEERSKTEATLEPLRAQFKDLEISIFEQLEKISALKNNILTNERKMNAMLNSVLMR